MTDLLFVADLLARILISVVLVLASIGKLFDTSFAVDTIRNLILKDSKQAFLFTISLSLIELSLGLGLLFDRTVALSSSMSFLLSLAFAFFLAGKIKIEKAMSCGCFGKERQEKIGYKSIMRSCVLSVAALVVWVNRTFVAGLIAETIFVLSSLAFAVIGVILLSKKNRNRRLSDTTNRESNLSVAQASLHSRRAILRLFSAIGISIFFRSPQSVVAAGCCKCEYQRHYDPICCPGSPLGVHHY